jgi:hypothetical protein
LGTAATDGWFGVSGAERIRFNVNVAQMSVTGAVYVSLECRNDVGSLEAITQVYETSYAAAGVNSYVLENASRDDSGGYGQCRVGLKIDSADDGADTGGDLEIIDVTVVTR